MIIFGNVSNHGEKNKKCFKPEVNVIQSHIINFQLTKLSVMNKSRKSLIYMNNEWGMSQ